MNFYSTCAWTFCLTMILTCGAGPSATHKPLKPARQGGIYVVAHRGSHAVHPENTLAAYQQAIDEGADLIEIDVRTTRDHRFISFHDAFVTIPPEGKRVRISDLTLQQLQTIDLGGDPEIEKKFRRIPELSEICKLCKGRIGIYLDLKQAPVDTLVQMMRAWGMSNDVWWYADEDELEEVLKLCPECLIMPDPGEEKNLQPLLQRFHPLLVATTWEHFTPSFARRCHQAGAKVIMDDRQPDCWSQALEWGCDGIQTDHPAELIDFLTKR
ncbi:glycerophosphodiester phosphodiesterase family protein [bacterium]|nr:glycerophosphodiester phosphodiesterase family protein [bacterium]